MVDAAQSSWSFPQGWPTPLTLLLVGAGEVAQAICPLAKCLGLRVAILDDEAELANQEHFPEADEIIVTDIATGIKTFPTSSRTAIVIATRGHRQDHVGLREAALSSAWYVGMVSRRSKVAPIYLQLLEEGISFERLETVHAPIGLDIGARTPEEIALSILAEIVMARSGKQGGPLSSWKTDE